MAETGTADVGLLDPESEKQTTELPNNVSAAYNRIKGFVYRTPLLYCPYLSDSAQVYMKLENEQVSGSFKVRGAYNKLLLLKAKEADLSSKGVITASTGNHGIGCMLAARTCDCPVEVFCREGISDSKRVALQKLGAKISTYGQDCVESELKARETAQERGVTYISAYNDWDVIAGQGTIGVEILEQLPSVDCILVSVGGGGLIGGIAKYVKHKNPNIQVIGCQPYNSKIMYESVKLGRLAHGESQETLSDGTVGDVEDGAVTFPLCRDYVDNWLLVTEEQISDAVYFMLEKHHKLIEGSAGMQIAAYLANKQLFEGKTVILLLCGANIGTRDLKKVIDSHIDN